jgi:hypothetical protein
MTPANTPSLRALNVAVWRALREGDSIRQCDLGYGLMHPLYRSQRWRIVPFAFVEQCRHSKRGHSWSEPSPTNAGTVARAMHLDIVRHRACVRVCRACDAVGYVDTQGRTVTVGVLLPDQSADAEKKS